LPAAALALLIAGCGHAGDEPDSAAPQASELLCLPAEEGGLRARLQGSIEAELDWFGNAAQCRGGPRPDGDGVRLLYKGTIPDGEPVLIVLGVGPLKEGQAGRNVPVNLTLVREGAGQFFATQGPDKCALDEVRQEPLTGTPRLYRLTGRGYCLQPARALGGGEGAVLVSRFDVLAIVDYR
jgi:hypothetical protein